jgi:hypothetical protein
LGPFQNFCLRMGWDEIVSLPRGTRMSFSAPSFYLPILNPRPVRGDAAAAPQKSKLPRAQAHQHTGPASCSMPPLLLLEHSRCERLLLPPHRRLLRFRSGVATARGRPVFTSRGVGGVRERRWPGEGSSRTRSPWPRLSCAAAVPAARVAAASPLAFLAGRIRRTRTCCSVGRRLCSPRPARPRSRPPP